MSNRKRHNADRLEGKKSREAQMQSSGKIVMRMFFSILSVTVILSGCSHPVVVQEAKTLSDNEIRSLMKEGYFRTGRGLANTEGSGSWWKCPGNADAATVCELVNQDRRSIVNEILRTYPIAKTCYPLLACSPNKEAYNYWKAQGAPVGELHGMAGAQYKLPNQSLRFAAGIANPEIVALHLLDGADPEKRSGYAVQALDEALHTWDRARNLPEAGGYLLPMDREAASDLVDLKPNRRNRRSDAGPAAEVVEMLIEAGASLNEKLSDEAIFYTDLPGRRDPARFSRSGRDLKDYYIRKLPELAEMGRRADKIRMSLMPCQKWSSRSDCDLIVANASPRSPARVWAQRKIAEIEGEPADWNRRLAAQSCRLQGEKNLVYEGSACAGGLAQGRGRARSRNKQLVYEGEFVQGQISHGRLLMNGHPWYEGGFKNWQAEGAGTCWYNPVGRDADAEPERCHMQAGDGVYEQRQAYANLRNKRDRQERAEADARQQQQWQRERELRAQQEEERRERRRERESTNSSSYDPLASTLRMAQQQNQIIAQGNADIRRAQAQREEARREQARREAAEQEAERRARQQAQQRLAAQQSQQATAQEAERLQQQRNADAQRARDEEVRRAREEETRRQQLAQADAARKEAERQQREQERQTKLRDDEKRKADYLRAVKDGTRMKVISCPGGHYVTGTRALVKELVDVSSCVDVSVTAWCPGDRAGRPVVATNFIGVSGCLGDTYKIEPKPACEAEQMRVVVEEVRSCR